MEKLIKNRQYYKFCLYGFLKNLRFFDAFFILFLLEKGMSYTQIGILYAVREISINVFEIPSGIAADTFGRKNSLMGSFFVYIFSFILFYFSGNFWLFLTAFVLYGLGDAFRTGTHKGMIMDYLKSKGWEDQKINYYGHTRSWSQKGSAASSLIAGAIVLYSGGYDKIFLYSTVPYLLNLVLISSYPGKLNRTLISENQQRSEGIRFTVRTFLTMIRQPRVLQIINTSAFHTAFLSAVKDYIQPLMVSVAVVLPVMSGLPSEGKIGVVVGVIYFLIYILTSYASGTAAKVASGNRGNISYLTLILGFLLGVLSGLFFVFDLRWLSLVAFIGIFLVENVRKPILTGFVADEVPFGILASVISAQSLLKTVMTAIIAFSVGWLADRLGVGKALLVVSAMLVIASVLIHLYRKESIKKGIK